jgi:hypothetical protein
MKVIYLASIRNYESDIKERVKSAQEIHEFLKNVNVNIENELIGLKYEGYRVFNDGPLTYKGQLYISNFYKLKKFIMDELHKRPYTGHPDYQKMITTNKKLFYRLGMKKDIVDY